MGLNLKYYKGIDKYLNSIEDKTMDSNIRKNVINWYPFKPNSTILVIGNKIESIIEELCNKCSSVTTIELSKKRAESILEKNKKTKNLEIIVGEFEDIIIEEKYDYILLIGTLEYINKLKNNLKKDGKILLALDNELGLKYWCGANEENDIKTFTRKELEEIIDDCNMKANFYYMFPNYRFPQVIYTDESLKRKVYANYLPYYSKEPILSINEISAYRSIYDNNLIPYFANSYFIELSNGKSNIEIDFVKFNSFRKDEYNLYTYSKNNKYYKKNNSKDSEKFLKEYYKSSDILTQEGFNAIGIKKDTEGYYTDEIKTSSFLDYVLNDYKINGEKNLIEKLKEYEKYLSDKYNKFIELPEDNSFKKYKVKIGVKKINKLHFLKSAFIDIIPQNMLSIKKDYYLIDQEWKMDNVPYEFVLYRGIINVFQNIDNGYELANKYLEIFNLIDYSKEFSQLEKSFQLSTLGIEYSIFEKHSLTKDTKEELILNEYLKKSVVAKDKEIISKNEQLVAKDKEIISKNEQLVAKDKEIIKKNEQIVAMDREINEKNAEIANLKQELNNLLNSGSWKITKPIRYVNKIIKNNKE